MGYSVMNGSGSNSYMVWYHSWPVLFEESTVTSMWLRPFDTIWIEGLVYKLTILNFPSYLVKTISLHLHSQTVQMSFHLATSTGHSMWDGVA
jgi:hypothetical protein